MPEWGKAEFEFFYSSLAERWGHPSTRPPIRLHYHWFPVISGQMNQAPHGMTTIDRPGLLVSLLGLNVGDALVMVGCGFNGTGAGLEALGVRVIGTELSTYIQNEKGNTEEAEIRAACLAAGVDPDADSVIGPPGNVMWNPLDLFMEGGRVAPKARGKGSILTEDLRTTGSKNAILREFERRWGSLTPRYVVSEEVLNSIPDNEAALVCDHMQSGATSWGATVVHMLSPLRPGESQASGLNWKTYAGWRSWLNTNGFTGHLILPTVTADGQGMTLPADEDNPGRVMAYSGLI